jgi:hypothetical protein
MVEGFASRLRAGDNAPFHNGQQIPNHLFVRGNLCFDASPSLDEPSIEFGGSFATATRSIRHCYPNHSPLRPESFATATRSIHHCDPNHSYRRYESFTKFGRSFLTRTAMLAESVANHVYTGLRARRTPTVPSLR